MKYELLEEGQRTKEGDEVFKDGEWLKLKDGAIGFVTFKGYVYRRALPDKPKVRLEELTKVAMDAWHRCNKYSRDEAIVESIKAICSHLGLELEEEKPEWEKAYRQYLSQAEAEVLTTDVAKAMFEAGQACEKARGYKKRMEDEK